MWSHSPSRRADEYRQEELFSLKLADVIDKKRSESHLPEAPSEGRKIRGGFAGLNADEQPSLLYRLPIGDASADIFTDIGDRISSTTSGMRLKKVSKLLSYSDVRSCRFYSFEREEVS